MSVRRVDFARLETAGWTVTVDSPWRRLVGRLFRRSVDRAVSTDRAEWSR
jgi:hypothetical protein